MIATRAAADADRAVTADVLARAFIDDPAMAHVFRNAADRPRRLGKFFTLIGKLDPTPMHWTLALDRQLPVAAAMWRPPGSWATPASAMLRLLPQLLGAFGTALPRALAMQAMMDAHHPQAPHWYLQFAGCVPASQGKGFGGAAIRERLRRCDAEALPAALETATEANLGLYRALGFDVTDRYRIKGGPMFWTMWREPRSLQD